MASPQRPAPAGVETVPLAEQPLRILVPPGDALAGATGATMADLRGRPFVLPEPGAALRETVVAACQAAGFSPVPLFEISDPATVRFLAHAGLGVSVVPASWLALPGPDVGVAELAAPAPRHRVALLVPAGREQPAGRLLREALSEHLRELGLEPLARAGAHEPLHLAAVAEEDERRHREHAVLGRGALVGVDVELDDAEVVALGGQLGEHRLHHAARRAPGRGEVDEHGPFGLEHLGGERVVGHGGDRGHASRLAATAPASKSNP